MRSTLLLATLATCAAALPAGTVTPENALEQRAARSAPSGSITVCSSGCKYTTIQAAVSSLSKTSTSAQVIYIYAGTYSEQVTIPALAGKLTIYGETSNTASYSANTVNIQHTSSLASGAASDQATSTLINLSANTAIYNVNVTNGYGKGSQAVALSAYNTKQGYYGVALLGYQDTLLAQTGNQAYAACYIEGAVDFIFGQYARAWITKSVLASKAAGTITANGRASSDDAGSYYVIDHSTVQAAAGASVSSGSVYLGRPWGAYARVVFQNTAMSAIINAAGWEVWSSTNTDTSHVVFEEYANTGAGASGTRASFSSKLSAAVSISTILGSDYSSWVDSSYL